MILGGSSESGMANTCRTVHAVTSRRTLETTNEETMQTIELPRFGIHEKQFNTHTTYTIKENTLENGLLVERVLCEVYSEEAANQIVAALELNNLQLTSNYEVNR